MELPAPLKPRWVQALLVILLALWAHKKWRYSRYAAAPYPDAWVRGADEHRRYITRLTDFVDLYSQGIEVDQLEEHLGVHTHCGHSQAALITYFCGRAIAGSDRSSWVAGQDADVFGVEDLTALLRMLRNASPAARARGLHALINVQEQVQAAVSGKAAPAEAAEGAAAASGGAQQADPYGAEGEQQEEEAEDVDGADDAYDTSTDVYTAEGEEEEAGEEEGGNNEEARQLHWDGRQLPQLVLRCHMDGDNVAYHTFVIASRPDLQFDMYQSFIGHYTLHDYLWSHPKPLSFDQMMQFLADVRELERATKWTRAVDKKYHSLFGVSLSRTHGYRGVRLSTQDEEPDKYAGMLPDSWQMGHGTAMRFRWSLACGIPPANSTAMAASKQKGAQCGEGGSGCRGYSPFDFS